MVPWPEQSWRTKPMGPMCSQFHARKSRCGDVAKSMPPLNGSGHGTPGPYLPEGLIRNKGQAIATVGWSGGGVNSATTLN